MNPSHTSTRIDVLPQSYEKTTKESLIFFLIKCPKYRLLLTLLNWMDGCFCVFKRDCMAFSVDGSARNLSFRYVLGRCSAATTVSRLYDVDA